MTTLAFSLLSSGIFRGNCLLGHVLGIGVKAIEDGAYEGLEEVHMVAFGHDEASVLEQLFTGTYDPLKDPSRIVAVAPQIVPVSVVAVPATATPPAAPQGPVEEVMLPDGKIIFMRGGVEISESEASGCH